MEAKVITFFSTKGGVGKTFLSLNLAVQLAIENKKVFLLDVDLGAPQQTFQLLGTKAKYCLANLGDYMDEFKTKKRDLTNYTVQYKKNLSFLPSVFKVSQRVAITPQMVKDFLSLIWNDYDYVIIDAGSNLTDTLIATLECSNLIFLTLTPDIIAVYQTQWLLDTLQSLGFPIQMIKSILNRAESKGGISWHELKVVLPTEIMALIPSDGKTVGFALNRKLPVVVDSPHSKISLAIKKLIKDLARRQDIYVDHKTLADIRIKKEEFVGDELFWQRTGVLEQLEKVSIREEEDRVVQLKKRVHQRLLEELDLKRLPIETYTINQERMTELTAKAERTVSNIITREAGGFISSAEIRKKITREIVDEALGLGPLQDLIRDPSITEIMVNNKDQVYIERMGKIELTSKKFTSDDQVRIVIERILAPLGRRIDESVPYVDARLPDGSRVNAVIPPLALTGPNLTIRKFARQRFTMNDLVTRLGSIDKDMTAFLEAAVVARKNVLVSGGTGSGKTTFLNILSHYIPDKERIVTIEDSAELKLNKAHWLRLESRPPNIEGKGEITIRDLFRNSLRMRPDRIIVGEVRGKEVLDMLQAMNTGHDGSMSTVHANSTHDVLIRLDSMILMSGVELPIRAIREMISSAIHLIVHVARMSDGSRKVIQIAEVCGMLDETHVNIQDVFVHRQTGVATGGAVEGYFTALGYIPTFYEEMVAQGLKLPREIFVPKE